MFNITLDNNAIIEYFVALIALKEASTVLVIAIESADIVLVENVSRDVVKVIDILKRTCKKIK